MSHNDQVPPYVERHPSGSLAGEGTAVGDQLKNQFVASLLDILGEPELLWMPDGGDTTQSTELTRNADVIVWDADASARLNPQGSPTIS